MTIAERIHDDPRIGELNRGELTELLSDLISASGLDDGGFMSEGGACDALYIALRAIPFTPGQEAKIMEALEETFASEAA